MAFDQRKVWTNDIDQFRIPGRWLARLLFVWETFGTRFWDTLLGHNLGHTFVKIMIAANQLRTSVLGGRQFLRSSYVPVRAFGSGKGIRMLSDKSIDKWKRASGCYQTKKGHPDVINSGYIVVVCCVVMVCFLEYTILVEYDNHHSIVTQKSLYTLWWWENMCVNC